MTATGTLTLSSTEPEGVPLVSVVMSNYCGARHLGAALASVLAQSQSDLELIVVDDASDDDSAAILAAAAQADGRIVPLLLKTNRGPGGARNAALDVARGSWIALVDSDDLVHPHRLERLLRVADATGADMVADNPVPFGAPETAGRPLVTRQIDGTWRIGPAEFIQSDTATTGTSSLGYLKPLIRRSLLEQLRYDESLRIGEDFDLYFRLLLAGAEFRMVPDPTYLYRRHEGSVSHRLSVAALSNLLAAQGRAEALCAARPEAQGAVRRDAQGGEADDLAAALSRRRGLLAQALRYERLVAAIKARRVFAAGRQVLRHPSLLGNLRESLRDRARRRAARDPSVTQARQGARTLVLAAPERLAAIDAPEDAERLAVPPMRAPGAAEGADHLALACRLAQIGPERLDVIADGADGVHALGYLSGWRSALIRLPQGAPGDVALPAGVTLDTGNW